MGGRDAAGAAPIAGAVCKEGANGTSRQAARATQAAGAGVPGISVRQPNGHLAGGVLEEEAWGRNL